VLTGELVIGAGSTLTIDTTWQNLGEATIDSQGTLIGDGTVTPTGTFHFLSSGTINGDLTIDLLATASIDVVYAQGNVTNNGTLTGEDQDAQFHMLGLLFTNYGTVSTDEFYFEKGGGAVQGVTGSGSWNGGIDYLFVSDNTHLTAHSNLTFNPQHFSIGDDGDLLDIGNFKVTFKAPGEVIDAGTITGSSGGSIHTQDEGLSIQVLNGAHFYPPLVVENGVTHASGVFSGSLTVEQEGTLRVIAPPAGSIIATGNVTVNGVLDGESEADIFEMRGQHLTVNGSVSVASLVLNCTSTQDITGYGYLDLHNLSVLTPGGVNLAVRLYLDGILELNANLYVDDSVWIGLDETAILSGENSDKDIFGSVERYGPFIKDKSYSFGNLSLTVTFTDAGSALPTSVIMVVKRTPWGDLPGSINRSYSMYTMGGNGWVADLKLDYRDSELHGKEVYLQTWTRPSSSSVPWARFAYTEANLNQNWIKFEGLTHFSDWGLAIQTVFIPMVKR
jgi:hypothetical protein